MSEGNPAPIPAHFLHRSKPDWAKRVALGIVFASLLFLIVILMLPMVVRTGCGNRSDQVEAVSNARQIGLALLEFETEYGTYPSDATAALVTKSHPDHGFDLSGKSSNAMFRQLLAAGMFRQLMAAGFTQNEWVFYAKVKNARKADGNILPGKALEKGEVGFAYISGLSSKEDPVTPILLAPMIPGTTRFDPKPFKGKAVVLHTDLSVRSYEIKSDGHIYDKGIRLLSPKHPIWKGKKPDIRYPE